MKKFIIKIIKEIFFFGPETKNDSIAIIILAVLLFSTKSNSSFQSTNWALFYFLLLIEIALIIKLTIKIVNLLKWKKSINEYLDFVANHKTFKLIAAENTITIKLDENVTQEKWNEIKGCEINNEFISIKSNYDYFLPKKSMTEIEFESLKNILSEKINE
ncbi:MAG: hypothetical protein BGO29_16225 [Bacteroidales bacterium 36-12]|nr:MAG: hypothetical protein BGO29_16225 [Bacteroidales bacterium 36-12]